MMRTLSAMLLVAATGGVASANAFVINEQDAAATGRGNAATATDTAPSAIFYNVGGFALESGTNISIGGTLVAASGSYTDLNGNKTNTDQGPAVLPTVFATSKVTDMVSVGIGFHLPFGLAISWPSSSPQNDVIEKQSLRTYFITPAVGLDLGKALPGLSVGAGVDIVPSTVELTKAVSFGDTVGSAHLGGKAVGVGGRIGVQYHPSAVKQLSVGAAYRTGVKLDYKGKGDFDIDPAVRAALPADGDISTTINLPMSFAVGAAYRPIPELELELDAVWMQWSKFDKLTINLPGGATSVTAEDYKDTTTIRVGAEYRLAKQHAAVRAGYSYDPTPIPATTLTAQLPDANRNVVTAGGSIALAGYTASLGLLAVLPTSRSTSDMVNQPFYKGTYDVSAFVASLSLSGRFGAK